MLAARRSCCALSSRVTPLATRSFSADAAPPVERRKTLLFQSGSGATGKELAEAAAKLPNFEAALSIKTRALKELGLATRTVRTGSGRTGLLELT